MSSYLYIDHVFDYIRGGTFMTLEHLKLRNRLPENISDDLTAREVAKDLAGDIDAYNDLPSTARKCIKYILIAGLLELRHNTSVPKTVGSLFFWCRQSSLVHQAKDADQYFEFLDMVPREDFNLARFHICDSLWKYHFLDESTKKNA